MDADDLCDFENKYPHVPPSSTASVVLRGFDSIKDLRGHDSIKGYNKNKAPINKISKKQLKRVWKRLRDRLASVDPSTSTIEITDDYAAHFYDMCINEHDGKHMTGDSMKILLLNLPFLLRDLVAPEVRHIIISDISADIIPDIVVCIPDITTDIIRNIISEISTDVYLTHVTYLAV